MKKLILSIICAAALLLPVSAAASQVQENTEIGVQARYLTAEPTATPAKKHTHTYGSWTVTKSATVLSGGTKKRTCSSCGKVEQKKTAKLTRPSVMMAKGVQKGSGSIQLTWSKCSGARGYEVYGRICDGKENYSLLKRVTKTSWTQNKRKGNASYKYYVKAYCYVGGKKVYLAKSPTIHIAMKKKTVTNTSKLKVSQTKVSLKAGKTFRLKTQVTLQDKKKKLLAHVKSVRYYTSDSLVATVDSTGKIKARTRGSCRIYAVTPNGLWKTVTVTVK